MLVALRFCLSDSVCLSVCVAEEKVDLILVGPRLSRRHAAVAIALSAIAFAKALKNPIFVLWVCETTGNAETSSQMLMVQDLKFWFSLL